MKNLKHLGVVMGVVVGTALTQMAQAAQGTGPTAIAGSISFVGNATTDGTSIANATEFTSIAAKVQSDSGDYALVPSMQGATPGVTSLTSTGVKNVITDYSFNPSQNTVTPLWKFTVGAVTYSFDATTLDAVFDSSADQWNISGLGEAFITGGGTDYSATPGSWTAVVSGSKTSFNFGSAEDPPVGGDPVPDGGLTIALMGGALIGLFSLRKKLV